MPENESNHDIDNEETLSEQFRKAEDVVNDIESGRFSAADSQTRVSETVCILENLTRAVSSLGLFSDNEEVEDLPTSSIPFLLIPCYLGVAHHNTTTDPLHRADQLQLAKVYYLDFLKRLRSYGFEFDSKDFLINGENEESTDVSRAGIKKFTGEEQRERKIARFRKQRELKNTMDELKRLNELPLVEMMKARMKGNVQPAPAEKSLQKDDKKPAPLRPFIITRSEQQKAVFGLGYPSIPTMTVDEWYNQRFGGASSAQQQQHQPDNKYVLLLVCSITIIGILQLIDSKASHSGEIDTEEAEERERARLMRWDEYKDDHRRGWGNTHNKG
ncbi:unnamed protein product [Haemonchus placei]|uniref:TAP42 domain-containing protein n=1 Tax=Haemonchus placei TaxID=6290 RepID=A0A0N4WDD5_HAEPC|nr:unnamed protein product [Haemonchus placei]